jgi:hypothetical protein
MTERAPAAVRLTMRGCVWSSVGAWTVYRSVRCRPGRERSAMRDGGRSGRGGAQGPPGIA